MKEIKIDNIYCMDCIRGLRLMASNSVDCCITSPPYYGLRDYGVSDQIELESSLDEYIDKLTDIFSEILRILKPQGTLWLIIGDSYVGSYKAAAQYPNNTQLKKKDLIGIPWMLAFALRSIGYYLRQDIIWFKPNAMPESVKDRCTKSHEYIFLLSKSNRYYFDSETIKQPAKSKLRSTIVKHRRVDSRVPGKNYKTFHSKHIQTSSLVNKRDVWIQNTRPSGTNIHFAAFPPELIHDCVIAGCPQGGVILDPFMGTGTTAMVALQNQRHYVGFEINPDYIPVIDKKIQIEPNIFV